VEGVEESSVRALAITNHERLLFGYRAFDGTESDRRAEPHGLVSAGHKFDVHEPPELIEYLRSLGARLSRAVSTT
jgi:hypothetical protein